MSRSRPRKKKRPPAQSLRKLHHLVSAEPDHATTALVIAVGFLNALLLPTLGLLIPSVGQFLSRSVTLHRCLVLLACGLATLLVLVGVSVHRNRSVVVIGLLGALSSLIPVLPWVNGCCALYQSETTANYQGLQLLDVAYPMLTLTGHGAMSIAAEINRRLLVQLQHKHRNIPRR